MKGIERDFGGKRDTLEEIGGNIEKLYERVGIWREYRKLEGIERLE